jgi:hypothetical protein
MSHSPSLAPKSHPAAPSESESEAPPSSKSGVHALAFPKRVALTPEQRTDLRIMRKQNELIVRDGCGRPACNGRNVCMFERQAQIALLAVAALEAELAPASVRA